MIREQTWDQEQIEQNEPVAPSEERIRRELYQEAHERMVSQQIYINVKKPKVNLCSINSDNHNEFWG